MALNVDALKVKVGKAIMKMPDEIEVYRRARNAFGEPMGEKKHVVTLTGQYTKDSNMSRSRFITPREGDAGTTKSKQVEQFMVVIDDDSALVREGDRFKLNGGTYEIIDLGDTLGVYFDFALDRVVDEM